MQPAARAALTRWRRKRRITGPTQRPQHSQARKTPNLQAHRKMKGDAEWEAITQKVAGAGAGLARARAPADCQLAASSMRHHLLLQACPRSLTAACCCTIACTY